MIAIFVNETVFVGLELRFDLIEHFINLVDVFDCPDQIGLIIRCISD